MNTILSIQLIGMHINSYLTIKVYFRSRIIFLTKEKGKAMREIYEQLLLIKLKLGIKFLKAVMHSRNIVLGIQIIKLQIAVAIIAMRMYIINA